MLGRVSSCGWSSGTNYDKLTFATPGGLSVLTWPTKDPDEVLDYEVDWTARLVTAETISVSVFSVVSGDVAIANSPAPSIVGPTTLVWLTGGSDGTPCVILNRITTSGGRIYDESMRLRIRSH